MTSRRVRVLLPLASVVAVCSVPVACLSNNNSGGSDLDASFDASEPDVGSPSSDAGVDSAVPPSDAGVEASAEAAPPPDAPVDAAPEPLTVTVGGPLGLEEGLSVVWSDASGAVLGTSTTDASGSASTTSSTVSMLTVVMGTVSTPVLYTVQGVSLGQSIVVADESSTTQYFATVTSVPTVPTLGDGGPLTEVEVSGTCGGSLVGSQMSLSQIQNGQSCIGLSQAGSTFEAAFPLLVLASDSDGNPLGYAYANANAPIVDGGAVDVVVGGDWHTTTVSQTLVVGSNDAGQPSQVFYSEVADAVVSPLQGSAPAVDAGDGAMAFQTHPGFASTVQSEADFPYSEGIGVTVVASSSLPPTSSAAVTLETTAIQTAPVFASVSPSFSGAQPTISWTLASGAVTSATAIVAKTSWSSEIDGGSQNGTWTIVSPGTSASILTAPILPASLGAYRQGGSESYGSTLIVAIDGGTALPSYSSALPMTSLFQEQTFECGANGPLSPPIPGIGEVVLAMFGDSTGC